MEITQIPLPPFEGFGVTFRIEQGHLHFAAFEDI